MFGSRAHPRHLACALAFTLAFLAGCFVDTSGRPTQVPDASCGDCDDGLECTEDQCDPSTAECTYTPHDERCPGRLLCDPSSGCADPGCTPDNCQAGAGCVTAECIGDDCVRTPSCGLDQICCGGICAAIGCDDGLGCTADRCGPEGCINEIEGGCLIDGACVASGDAADGNSCLVCEPASSLDRWTIIVGSSCDDGEFCTVEDLCDAAGACVGEDRSCDDERACTRDSCDEDRDRCRNDVTSGCLIAGSCIIEGATNPTNACQHCLGAMEVDGWSARTGEPCDDGRYCTTDETCSRTGSCRGGTMRDCRDTISCTSDRCNEASDRCESEITSGCHIDGMCVTSGSANPANQCERCTPSRSRTRWTIATGDSCDDGLFCQTGETCRADGRCVAARARSCADPHDCTADSCDEARDRCRNTLTGCLIDATCVGTDAPNPANSCQRCTPGASASRWTVSVGADCDDGLYCNSGETCQPDATCSGGGPTDCTDGLSCTADTCIEATDSCLSAPDGSAGCLIDGACFGTDTPHPSDPCLGCHPLTNPSAWTPTVGASCDDGVRCTHLDTCLSDGACEGTPVDCSGFDGVCASGICNESTGACGSREHPDSTPCDDGFACTSGDQCSSGACLGTATDCSGLDGECVRGMCDPLDGSCVPRGAPPAFSCDDDNPCTNRDACTSGGTCEGVARDCSGMCGGACPSTCHPVSDGLACECRCPP